MKNLLSKLFSKEESPVVGIEAETEEQSLQRGVEALDGYREAKGLEETQEKDFYCGICGWIPVSKYKEHMWRH